MARIKVKVVRLAHGHGLELPAYQTGGAAGMDLVAAVGEGRPLVLAPGKWALVPTGLVLELPKGYEAQVRPRSGLALRNGVTVLNSPGTIDSDYRGEVGVVLINLGDTRFKIERGARIAQLVVQKVEQVALSEVTGAGQSARGAGGFGSTGTGRERTAESGKARKAAKKNGTKIGRKAPVVGAKAAKQHAQRANGSEAGARGKAGLPALAALSPQNELRLNAHRRGTGRLRTRASPRSP